MLFRLRKKKKKTEKTHNLCGVFSSNINSTIKTMIETDIHKIFYLN